MFAFQSSHMYGIIGSAVGVGALSVFLIRRMKVKSLEGNVITLQDKAPGTNQPTWAARCLGWVGP